MEIVGANGSANGSDRVNAQDRNEGIEAQTRQTEAILTNATGDYLEEQAGEEGFDSTPQQEASFNPALPSFPVENFEDWHSDSSSPQNSGAARALEALAVRDVAVLDRKIAGLMVKWGLEDMMSPVFDKNNRNNNNNSKEVEGHGRKQEGI